MPSRKHRARIGKSRASKMWMESLEQRQLWAPIGGEFSPILVGDGASKSQIPGGSGSVADAWVSDIPRDFAAPRRDDDSPGGTAGVVVMVL